MDSTAMIVFTSVPPADVIFMSGIVAKKRTQKAKILRKLLQCLNKKVLAAFFWLSFCTIIDLCVYPKTKDIYFSPDSSVSRRV